MKKLFGNYKQLCSYVFWGTGTTIVNFTVFFLCTKLFHIHHLVSNGIAWVLAVTYAFISTKRLVFASKSWHPSIVFKELFGFVSARLLSGRLGMGIRAAESSSSSSANNPIWPSRFCFREAAMLSIMVSYTARSSLRW